MRLQEFLASEVNALREKDIEWKVRVLSGPSQPRTIIDGKPTLLLCSNNYLGLTTHPALINAQIEAAKKYGAGCGSVPVIAGTMDLHRKLEKTIARFKQTEAALYVQTGFAANAGSLPALLQEGDLAISDELNHGSIIDGLRLSKAERKVYKHKNMEELKKLLEESKGKHKKVFVITDGVFSMDGDTAPLKEIVELAEKYGAFTFVDDAHGDGVLGEHGRGIIHHVGVKGRVDVEIGTFSKAFGCIGGYVSGSTDLHDFILNKSRTYLLSGGHPPATVAACNAALELLEKDDSLVKKLWENTNYWKKELKSLGFDTGESTTPITPVMCGESKIAKQLSEELFREGVFALPIVFPMVALNKARIRSMVTAAHTREDLNQALAAFEKCGKSVGVI